MKRIIVIFILGVIVSSIYSLPVTSRSLTDSLVAYYPFNGNLNDESGNVLDGTPYGDIAYSSDRYDNSGSTFLSNGTSSGFSIPINNSNLDSAYTISYWSNLISKPDYSIYVCYNNDNDNRYKVHLLGAGGVYAFHLSDVSEPQSYYYLPMPEFGTWENNTVTYNNGNWKYYVNGQLVFEFYKPITQLIFSKMIWCTHQPMSSTYCVDGKIDDIRIYNRILSESEIDQLYANYYPPENFAGRAEEGCNILSWDTSEYVNLQKVKVFRDSLFYDELIIDGEEDSLFIDNDVTPGVMYQYSISSVDIYENESIQTDPLDVTAIEITFTDINAGLINAGAGSVAWGDYDNDGDLDLIVAGITLPNNPYNSITKIFRNDSCNFIDIGASLFSAGRSSADWGDYDNDGDLDLLLTGQVNANPGQSVIYRNDNGVFNDINAGLTGVWWSTSRWGDYDNDGDLDILLSGSVEGSIGESIIYRNDNGTFTEILSELPGMWVTAASWGDYDNDGDLDVLLSGDTGAGYISKIFRNDNGIFTDSNSGLTGVYMGSVSWGDYDNDGDLDLLISGNADSGYISKIYRNDNGVFSDIIAGLPGVTYGSASWGDYDNDGDLDILLTGDTGSGIISKIYRNDLGIFTDISAELIGLTASSAAWGDYDNDSDLDILLMGSTGSEFVSIIYRNNCITPNTIPNSPINLSSAVNGSYTVLSWNKSTDTETPQNGLSYNIYVGTSDLSGDIKNPMSDISTGYRKVVAIGNTNKTNSWTVKDLSPGTYYWGVQAVDNAFAGSEFQSVSSSFTVLDAPVAIAANSIQINSFNANWETVAGASGYRIDVDDNNDFSSPLTGYSDYDAGNVLTTTITGLEENTPYYYRIRAYNADGNSLNSATVTAQTLPIFSDMNTDLPGVKFSSAAWGDYDNDGDLDLFLSGDTGSGYISRIYRNDNGTYNDINAGLSNLFWVDAAWGDYDNDGDLDILFTGIESLDPEIFLTKLYRNDSGSFTEVEVGLINVAQGQVDWGDYDNDGDIDILLIGETGSGKISKIYRNDAGAFTDISADLTGSNAGAASWGDYDNDGDLDILLSGSTYTPDYTGDGFFSKIYRNDNGVFSDINAGLTRAAWSSAAWGDYDSDGDLDLILSGWTGGYVGLPFFSKIYRNDSGEFIDIDASLIIKHEGTDTWGDYDNDGDLDILMSGNTGTGLISKIYSNDNGEFTDILAELTEVHYSSVIWGDYDNDGDLDILLSGDTGSGFITKIYRNNCVIPNTAPNVPNNLEFVQDQNGMHFNFDPATDNETTSAGLTYNIDINVEDDIIKTASSDLTTGYRLKPSQGNIGECTSWTLNAEAPEEAIPQQLFDMTWKVQAVDNCFSGSVFASKNDTIMNRDLITVPKETMIATDALTWEYVMPSDSISSYTLQLSHDSLFTDRFETSFSGKKENKTAYFGIDLFSLGILDSLEVNEKYYWRVKPEHINPNVATGFKRVPDSFIYNLQYYAPSPVNIEVMGEYVTLSWNIEKDVGKKGEVYNVYSTDDPYAVFPVGWNYESTVNGTEWTVKTSEIKKFYCVTSTGEGKTN